MFRRDVVALALMCAALSMVVENAHGAIEPFMGMSRFSMSMFRRQTSMVSLAPAVSPTTMAGQVLNYSKLMSWTPIAQAINNKFNKDYPFDNQLQVTQMLNAEPDALLREIRDMEIGHVHCFYAGVAREMLKQLVETMSFGTKRPELRTPIVRLIDYSKTSWLKALSSIYTVGVYPAPILWRMAIYTNTAIALWSSVIVVNYGAAGDKPAEALATSKENLLMQDFAKKTNRPLVDVLAERETTREAVWNRLVLVTEALYKWAIETVNECAGKDVPIWDMRKGNRIDEANVHKMHQYFCPATDLEQRCTAIVPYAFRFAYVLNYNNNYLPYSEYEKFDPNKWLVDHETLGRMLYRDDDVVAGLQNAALDIEHFVRPVYSHEWLLHYAESYFLTVDSVLVGVSQTVLFIMRRNWTACKQYWRSVARDAGADARKTLERYAYDCTAIRPSVDMIVKKMQLSGDATVAKLAALLNYHFTSDAEFDAVIRVIDLKLSTQNTLFDEPLGAAAEVNYVNFFPKFHTAVEYYAKNLPVLVVGVDFTKEILDVFKDVIVKYDT